MKLGSFNKISWVRVLSATQALMIILFISVSYLMIKDLRYRPAEVKLLEVTPSKNISTVMPQLNLNNKGDCVDIVVTKTCDNNICQSHVNAFQVICLDAE